MSNKIEHCRACGSRALTPAFTLGGDNGWVICDPEKDATACGLLQRGWEMPAVPLHDHAACRTVRHRLRATVTCLMEMLSARDARALDIGCGDGTFLSYLPRWIDGVGVDRHLRCQGEEKWGTAIRGVFPQGDVMEELDAKCGGEKFDVISAISTFGEQSAPKEFLQAVKGLLARDGLVVIETAYASLALMRNNPSAFHADAQGVYTLTVLEQLARSAGLKIIRGGMTETDGGALRVFLTHADYHGYDDTEWLSQLARLWDEENSLALTSAQTCQAFSWRMERNRQRVQSFFDDARRFDQHAHVIGADAPMLAMLDWFGIDGSVVSALITRDADLHGSHVTLGQGPSVDVLCERELSLPVPDLIIASSTHRREALEHWREAIFDGARLVFMSPDLSIVDDANYGTELGKALAVTDGPGSVDTLRAVLASMQRPQLISVSTGT
ncbi:methyltransferase domain-containing protein [Parvularcula flava]|uniref:Methyltransferase domain-containing protein n=1 Tax=Aquisalinus luteolus TaxID=1566827 RepID=A0A8J3A6L4_9PROT|nr:class I SAM-dependent methyltransferase [Aquisalinus luteolus]NHK29266.1 methyltransferase domain-containing protein [Aquisalinus luteolus]GGI01298.1 hypothetical protein GCM10011355_31610 [Aquisalinus luteolus]